MAPGVHFQSRDHTWKNLHPWMRPRGIVAERDEVGIGDTQWHHVAWQYSYAEDVHELFLDGTPIWRMQNVDGRKLVNDREHDCQFSVFTRLTGYAKYGGGFNYLGLGQFLRPDRRDPHLQRAAVLSRYPHRDSRAATTSSPRRTALSCAVSFRSSRAARSAPASRSTFTSGSRSSMSSRR